MDCAAGSASPSIRRLANTSNFGLQSFRHAVDERVATDLCGGIADGGRRCRACAGDRAAGAKDDDVGGSLAGAASSADAKDACANVASAAHKTTSFGRQVRRPISIVVSYNAFISPLVGSAGDAEHPFAAAQGRSEKERGQADCRNRTTLSGSRPIKTPLTHSSGRSST